MIDHLGWESTQSRRKIARLAMMFKIRHDMAKVDFGITTIAAKTDFKLKEAPVRDRRSHSEQLATIQCRRDYRQNSFLPRTIKD